MAENKNKSEEPMIPVYLERNKGENAVQTELVSVNGKDYLVPRGKNVNVPQAVFEAISNAKNAENAYFEKCEKLAKRAKDAMALK